MPGLETRLYAAGVPLPEDTDEVLYVSIRDVAIDVEGSDADLKTTAEVELTHRDGSKTPERSWYYYQDSDTLGNWTRNDNALWHDYANFARHYLGREIATDRFSGVRLRYNLQPQESASIDTGRNDPWHGSKEENLSERGIVGTDASAAPAYAQDFASLSISCRAR